MKSLLSILLVSLLSTSLLSNDTKKETPMTDEEFLKQFMELEKRQEKAIAKTKVMKKETAELEELRKMTDKLVKTLGVDK